MKIAVVPGQGPTTSMRMSWSRVLEHIGHKVAIWSENDKPAFDFFDEFKPELVLLEAEDLTRAICKNLIGRPDVRLMLWAKNWGSFDTEIDREVDGGLLVSEEAKTAVEFLRQHRPDIDTVFTHHHPRWADVTHDRWMNLGLKVVSIPMAADMFLYNQGVFQPALESDVSFVGLYNDAYAKVLVSLCHVHAKLRVKIFGAGGWSVAQFLGAVNPRSIKNVLASAKIAPNLVYTHAAKYGFDVNERPFQILASGAFCISQYVESLAKDFFTHGKELLFTQGSGFYDAVRHYVAHPEQAIPFIENGLRTIREKHTYFHRVDEGLAALGISEGRDKLKGIIARLHEDHV